VITGSSSVAAAAGSNVKVVKAEENEDTMTHYHDDKKKLEQQQGQLSIKKKARTNVARTIVTAAAVNMDKKANQVTMKSTAEKKKASKCSVNFNETVIVIPIPTKDEYSDRIKSKLWTSKYEMLERIGKWTCMCLCVYLVPSSAHERMPIRLNLYITSSSNPSCVARAPTFNSS
jgi:hypothetical protein